MSLAADQQLARLIERGAVDGFFFLHGEADRLRDDAARRLIDAALDPATRDFNLDQLRSADTTPEAIASALSSPPVMAPRRVVALYEAERLKPTACKVVEDLLPKLPPDVTFIVTATIPKGSKKKFYRVLKDAGSSLEWKAPRDSEIPGWLIERARDQHGVTLAPDAAQALAAAVGSDLGILAAELEKLALASEGSVGSDLVRSLVPATPEVNRWEWLDAVAARHYREARRRLPALLTAPGESAVGLLVGLIEHHLLLGVAVDGGGPLVSRTLDQIGKPYLKFKTRTIASQAREWTAPELEGTMRLLLRADRRAKTGASDQETLEELLVALEAGRRLGAVA